MSDEPKAGDIVPVAYITKYALTEGIHEVHGWELVNYGGKFALRSTKPGLVPYSQTLIMPNGWTRDLNEAIERVKRALSMRIGSLEDQIARLKERDPSKVKVKR